MPEMFERICLTGSFDIGARLEPNEEMTGEACRQSGIGPGAAKIGEYIGRRRERANAVRDRTDRYGLEADERGGANARHAELIVLGAVDHHCSRNSQTLRRSFNDIPRRHSAGSVVGSDDDHRCHGSARQAPGGKSDHSRNDCGHAIDRQQAVPQSGAEKREILEVFGSTGNDPEVGRGVIDHRRDHAAEAEVKAHLHHHQHHRKNDAHERGHKAKPILEKISRRQRKDE